MSVLKDTSYTDAGATASDNYDGDISGSITSSGSVDINTLGNYTLTYDVTDTNGNAADQVSRSVSVVTGNIPVITLTGSGTINHEAHTAYVEPGATASDVEDGDISSTITLSGSIDIDVLGAYVFTYSVTDSN